MTETERRFKSSDFLLPVSCILAATFLHLYTESKNSGADTLRSIWLASFFLCLSVYFVRLKVLVRGKSVVFALTMGICSVVALILCVLAVSGIVWS